MDDLQYPVGRLERKPVLTDPERPQLIDQIAEAPADLRRAVAGLSKEQIDTPYRPGGWTLRQVVHHLPDSHMNAYVRVKLALTETHPAIKSYNEKLWAELYDVHTSPIEASITLLESLHQRWVILFRSMKSRDFQRTMLHSDHGTITVDFILQLYAWHGRHHVAHITSLRDRMGWK